MIFYKDEAANFLGWGEEPESALTNLYVSYLRLFYRTPWSIPNRTIKKKTFNTYYEQLQFSFLARLFFNPEGGQQMAAPPSTFSEAVLGVEILSPKSDQPQNECMELNHKTKQISPVLLNSMNMFS